MSQVGWGVEEGDHFLPAASGEPLAALALLALPALDPGFASASAAIFLRESKMVLISFVSVGSFFAVGATPGPQPSQWSFHARNHPPDRGQ